MGTHPNPREYRSHAEEQFLGWRLSVKGLVERPMVLSLEDLRALPKQAQITKHNCIQGWSAVAEWGGVRMSTILEMCRPLSQARYVIFHAFPQEEYAPLTYYEVLTLDEVRDPQTILAYEMNGIRCPFPMGRPVAYVSRSRPATRW